MIIIIAAAAGGVLALVLFGFLLHIRRQHKIAKTRVKSQLKTSADLFKLQREATRRISERLFDTDDDVRHGEAMPGPAKLPPMGTGALKDKRGSCKNMSATNRRSHRDLLHSSEGQPCVDDDEGKSRPGKAGYFSGRSKVGNREVYLDEMAAPLPSLALPEPAPVRGGYEIDNGSSRNKAALERARSRNQDGSPTGPSPASMAAAKGAGWFPPPKAMPSPSVSRAAARHGEMQHAKEELAEIKDHWDARGRHISASSPRAASGSSASEASPRGPGRKTTPSTELAKTECVTTHI